MTEPVAPPRRAMGGTTVRFSNARALLLLTAVVLACRGWIFGNPLVNLDEQFYLFVGERMWHGILPYADIWDRKPVGLFLIYALAARFEADPVLAYQLIASACVLATSWLIFRAALRFASLPAALAAAAAYPPWLNVYAGIGGQSPVFYNLPVLAAALWTMQAWLRSDDRHLTRTGCAIMVVVGIAMQIKYTAVFEGVFFGLSLLLTGFRRGRPLLRLGSDALLWVSCALLPTGAAWGWFAAIGKGDEFVQANFLSVLSDDNAVLPALGRLAGLLVGLVPLAICAWFAWRERSSNPRLGWLFAWAGACLAGFLVFGNWNDHYALPLLPPLCLLAAAGFDRTGRRRLAMALAIGLGVAGGTGRAVIEWKMSGNAEQAQRLLALVKPHVGAQCLYVNESLTYLYRLTGSCLPTRFTFPQHLAIERYAQGLGVDQMAELRRLLAARPDVIVMSTIPDEDTRWATRDMIEAVLKTDYRKVGTQTIGTTPFEVYARNDAPSRP